MSVHTAVQFWLRASSRQTIPASTPIVKAGPAAPPAIASSLTEHDRVRAALIAAGLSLPSPAVRAAGQLSPEQREELARRVSVGTPLSQIIIEERRGR